MNNDRIVLKSKSNFLSIPTGTIIKVSYEGGMVLEISYEAETSFPRVSFGIPRLEIIGLTKTPTFFFIPFLEKAERSVYTNLCAEIESANARKIGYSFEEI